MAYGNVENLNDLSPNRASKLPDELGNSPASFGLVKDGLHEDFLILLKCKFSGSGLMKALSPLSSSSITESIIGVRMDLAMPKQAIKTPKTALGKETDDARLKRIHETDPNIKDAWNEFRADSLRRFELAFAETQPTPLGGVIGWRQNRLTKRRRFLGRVEGFQAAAQIGIGLDDDADFFFGRSVTAIWTGREFLNWSTDIPLREGKYEQYRMLLQGVIMASSDHYNRGIFSFWNGLFPGLEKEIRSRPKQEGFHHYG